MSRARAALALLLFGYAGCGGASMVGEPTTVTPERESPAELEGELVEAEEAKKKAEEEEKAAAEKAKVDALARYEQEEADAKRKAEEEAERRRTEEDEAKWRRFLTKPVPNDLWGNPWGYRPESEFGLRYDLWSNGPDGEEGTDDDITNWTAEDEAGGGFGAPPSE